MQAQVPSEAAGVLFTANPLTRRCHARLASAWHARRGQLVPSGLPESKAAIDQVSKTLVYFFDLIYNQKYEITGKSLQPVLIRLRQIILEVKPDAHEVVRLGDCAAQNAHRWLVLFKLLRKPNS